MDWQNVSQIRQGSDRHTQGIQAMHTDSEEIDVIARNSELSQQDSGAKKGGDKWGRGTWPRVEISTMYISWIVAPMTFSTAMIDHRGTWGME